MVIDYTGSFLFLLILGGKKRWFVFVMYSFNYVAAVKSISTTLVNEIENTTLKPYLYILSLFNDPPSLNKIYTTTSGDEFVNALNAISVNGGGDCPEYSMSGILNALTYADKFSTVFLFTDAEAKDADIEPTVAARIAQKQITLVGILAGSCYSSRRRELEERRRLYSASSTYTDLALGSGGFLVLSSQSKVSSIIDVMKPLLLTSGVDVWISNSNLKTFTMQVWIDQTISQFTITTTCSSYAYPVMNITRPDGSKWSFSSSSSTSSQNYSNGKVVSSDSLMQVLVNIEDDSWTNGTWRIDVTTLLTNPVATTKVFCNSQLSFTFSLEQMITDEFEKVSGNLLVSNAKMFRIIALPTGNTSLLNDVQFIQLYHLNGTLLYQQAALFSVQGYYADFDVQGNMSPQDSLRVVVIGTIATSHNTKFTRVLNQVISFSAIEIVAHWEKNTNISGFQIQIGSIYKIPVNITNFDSSYQSITLNVDISGNTTVTGNVSASTLWMAPYSNQAITLIIVVPNDQNLEESQFVLTLLASTTSGTFNYVAQSFHVSTKIDPTAKSPTCIVRTNNFTQACFTNDQMTTESCQKSVWSAHVHLNSNTSAIDYVSLVTDRMDLLQSANITALPNNNKNTKIFKQTKKGSNYDMEVWITAACCINTAVSVTTVSLQQLSSSCNVGFDGCLLKDFNLNKTLRSGEEYTGDCDALLNDTQSLGNMSIACLQDNVFTNWSSNCHYQFLQSTNNDKSSSKKLMSVEKNYSAKINSNIFFFVSFHVVLRCQITSTTTSAYISCLAIKVERNHLNFQYVLLIFFFIYSKNNSAFITLRIQYLS
ncbi:hypothetical protein RFI_19376 [Reticulomyxa filosa]|uniref:Hemicentin-1-like von Willebrand factor A domain-containing protein n=1 Tax=Reticulomyxa filosa TaxID=46433 RepID=X6MVC1_RETFI|nr:hypothetical protein RFI_19376 [Reticulomyxa filosa]|eukprot:ETO17928.1 hypothetical protein RFI_19376 [Reticulomyxa filosa]